MERLSSPARERRRRPAHRTTTPSTMTALTRTINESMDAAARARGERRHPAHRTTMITLLLLANPLNALITPPRPTTITLNTRYAAIRAPFDSRPAGQTAECARRAIADGLFDRARASYGYYVHSYAPSRATAPTRDTALMLLRWALLEQRAANATGARDVFKLGARVVLQELKAHEDDATLRATAATLFTSWGLAEYRHRDALESDEGKARLTSLALLRHATLLDETKAPVLKWKQFSDDEPPTSASSGAAPTSASSASILASSSAAPTSSIPLATQAEDASETTSSASETTTSSASETDAPRKTKAKPTPDIRKAPPRGSPEDPFKLNVWKRSMLERYAKFQDDLLDAAKRGDEPALMAGVKNLEGRQGKRMTARSKGVVGTWRARWSLEGTVPDDAAAVTVFARDGSEAEDPELRDPVLDVGAPLRCDCGGATGTATPDGPATLAFAGLAALPFPAALRCTYLDERVFILRDAEDAVIVLERSA